MDTTVGLGGLAAQSGLDLVFVAQKGRRAATTGGRNARSV